ncbi:MAG: hypothetical protein HKP30_08540, partial [Myxococcales bacterium]|nr:hypothetical protein [Myxococcales bacterium]
MAPSIVRRPGIVLGLALLLTLASLAALVDLRTGSLRLAIDASLEPLLAETTGKTSTPDTTRGADAALVIG